MEEEERPALASPEGATEEAGASEDEAKLSPFIVAKDQPDWLPSGWVMEIRTQQSGANKGREIKCYTNLSTGSRLYSRKQLFRRLNGRTFMPMTRQTRSVTSSHTKKTCTSTYEENCMSNSSLRNALYEYHSKSLPSGWTKEIRFRMSEQGTTKFTTKFTFYVDPDKRYAFYSLKDAHRYIATGDVRKCVIKPQKMNRNEMHTIERELHVPASTKRLDCHRDSTKRCLFSDKKLDYDVEISSEVNKAHQRSSLSSRAVEEADPNYISSHAHLNKENSVDTKLLDDVCHVAALPARTLDFEEGRMSKSTLQSSPDSTSDKFSRIKNIGLDGCHTEVPDKLGQANETTEEVPLQQQREDLPALEVNLGETTLEQKNEERPQSTKHKRGHNPGSNGLKVVKVLSPPEVNLLDETMLGQKNEEQPQPIKRKRGRKPGSKRVKVVKVPPATEVNLLDGTVLEQKNEEQFQPIKRKRGRKPGSTRPKINTPSRTSERLAALRGNGTKNSDGVAIHHSAKLDDSHKRREKLATPWDERAQSGLLGRSPSQVKEMPSVDHVQFREFENYKHAGEECNAEEQDQLGRVSRDKQISPRTESPFGNSWTDPCLVFAFKMLTSDIPIFENSGNVKEYIQHLDSIPIEPASFRKLTSSSPNVYNKF